MRTIAAALLLASLLVAGCSKVQPLTEVSASLTTLPLPSGAAVVPSASGAAVESCDATASLRPFAAGGPNVDEIRRRCRLLVGVDQSTNLFSFRDPVEPPSGRALPACVTHPPCLECRHIARRC